MSNSSDNLFVKFKNSLNEKLYQMIDRSRFIFIFEINFFKRFR